MPAHINYYVAEVLISQSEGVIFFIWGRTLLLAKRPALAGASKHLNGVLVNGSVLFTLLGMLGE